MYRIIGADGRHYGPASVEQVRQWITEGRLNGQSQIQPAGATDWKPLSVLPEFADLLATQAGAVPPVTGAAVPERPPTPADFAARDYALHVGACFSRGWKLFQANFALLFLAPLIYNAIQGAIGVLAMIPFLGTLISLGNLVFVLGPFGGGLFLVFIKALRGQPGEIGDVFAGFRFRYWQLCLGFLIPTLLASLPLAPAGMVAMLSFIPAIVANQAPNVPILVIAGIVGLLGLIGTLYLSIGWMFTLPLVIDRRMDFWSAMWASWKMVNRHWWSVFALVLLVWLLNLAGVIACCVGTLFSLPIGLGALMAAYETIFDLRRTSAT